MITLLRRITNGYQTLSNENFITFVESLDPDPDNGNIMPDSIRVKEIHAALQADKFAVMDDDPDTARIANLGYYIERLARVMGISVNDDGSIRSIRQRKVLETGTIPSGWGVGQWAGNKGGTETGQIGGLADEDRDGIVYKNRCNRSIKSAFNDEDFELGRPTVVLCENWWQVWESYLEDLDQGLNWQEMGAMAIPSPFPTDEGTNKFCTFEGMGTLLAEVAYMLSTVSKDTSQTYISSIVTQAMGKAILQTFGTPISIGFQEYSIEGENGKSGAVIPVPVVDDDSPSMVQLLMNIIENQARLLGTNVKVNEPATTTTIP